MINFYNWTSIEVFDDSSFFLINILNFDKIDSLFGPDNLFFFYFISNFFYSIFFSTSLVSWISVLDLIIVSDSLLNWFYLDFWVLSTSLFYYLNFLFSSDQGNLIFFFLTLSPEYSFLMHDYFQSFAVYSSSLSNYYSTFNWTPRTDSIDFLTYLFNTLIIVIFLLLFFLTVRNSTLPTPFSFFLFRFGYFSNNFAFENRMQLDWVLTFLIFVLLLWVPLLMTYDDINVEGVELMHTFICLFFVFIIFFLFYKYSIHYFSFLENSVTEGYSSSFIAKQFVRDFSNTFALFLRFFLLFFRLNIYDGLDDFLDSYYIFFIDFDEDSYSDELFFFQDFFFFFSDNREDVIFYQNMEFEWWGDLYSKYFILFGKFFFFWLFILEEIFRVSLALYISYLIIFEVHAVNVSFNESSFVAIKKLK
jgi:hypothetical protein